MANVNQVVVEGNLVKSAELSRWGDGTPYIRFTIANNEYYKNQQGQYESIPSFIDCQCKGPYAESMRKHLLKGRRITVVGRLKQQRWKDEHDQNHSAIVVKVQEISLAPLQQASSQGYQDQPAYQPEPDYTTEASGDMFDGNEEIPF